tara:strand:- start:127 stop:414 length:288 start_codon:yes stop_codon:yes gene_type:complete
MNAQKIIASVALEETLELSMDDTFIYYYMPRVNVAGGYIPNHLWSPHKITSVNTSAWKKTVVKEDDTKRYIYAGVLHSRESFLRLVAIFNLHKLS